MSPDEKDFFQKLGARIAQRGLIQLAEVLGYSQQQVLSFEKGRRRVPVSALSELSKALGVSVEELLGAKPPRTTKRGPAPKLQRQLEQLSQLP